jgi:tetratricopeptide (TPR) repeat protein
MKPPQYVIGGRCMRNLRHWLFVMMSIVFCAVISPVSAGDSPVVEKTSAVIVLPPAVFSGKQMVFTVDGAPAKKKTGRRTLELFIAPGVYDLFGITSSKVRTTIKIVANERTYIVKHGEPTAEKFYGDLRDNRVGGDREYAFTSGSRDNAGERPQASLAMVRPAALFGAENGEIAIDGKRKRANLSMKLVSTVLSPGIYDLFSGASSTPTGTVSVKPGEFLYCIRADDARSQRMLGDIMYENNARPAAFARYRQSLAIDSLQKDLYRRYADLALESASTRDALAALQRLVAVGIADGQVYQSLGDLLLKYKRPGEAQAMYEKAVAITGENPDLLANLGDASRKAGDIRRAAAAYGKAITLAPDSLRYLKTLGDILMKLKDTTGAMNSYQTFIQKGGRNNAVAYTLGAYAYRLYRYEDAVRYLVLVTDKQIMKFEYLYMLGASYYNNGDYARAAEKLRVAATQYPKNKKWPATVELLIQSFIEQKAWTKADFWVKKYTTSVKRGNGGVAYCRAYLAERTSPAAARALYEKNVKTYPDDYRNYLRLGHIDAATPATRDRAITFLKKSIVLADTIAEPWLEIARVYRQLERPADELSALQVFVASAPEHPESNARIGELMLQSGKNSEAIERLETAEKSGAADPQILVSLAKGYLKLRRTDEAITTLERAKQLAPQDTALRKLLISAYRKAGRSDAVTAEVKALVAIQPDIPTLLLCANHLYSVGEYAQATEAVENILSTDPQHIKALMYLATILRAQEKYADAIDIYKMVSDVDATYVPALFERAETYMANSQPTWADLFYKRTLKADPRHARAVLGLARVARLQSRYDIYRQNVRRAHAMAPQDTVIAQEYESGRGSGAGRSE